MRYATEDRTESNAYLGRFRLMVPERFKALKHCRPGQGLDDLITDDDED